MVVFQERKEKAMQNIELKEQQISELIKNKNVVRVNSLKEANEYIYNLCIENNS